MTTLAPSVNIQAATRQQRLADPWLIGSVVIAAIVSLPILAVFWMALTPEGDIWAHLVSTVLPGYITTSLGLMIGVGLGTLIIGTGCAWLVTMCQFPGRKIFEWALLLPLAIPSYVIAYVYTDLLEFAGPVQGMLRDIFGWASPRDYWFPPIRSLGGAITMMTLTLYAYVYLLARAAFLEQSICVLEVSRTLGRGPWASFFKLAVPLARPAIVIGVSLVLMESLNDFGTVDFFAVNTFSLGIYDVWLNMSNPSGAAQLACVLLFFVVGLIMLERFARRKQKFHHTTTKYRPITRYRLTPWAAFGAFLACALPLALGFILPASVLSYYALHHYEETLNADYWSYTLNSLTLSGSAAVIALGCGIFLAYGVRLRGGLLKALARFASLGYAIPGAVLAVGVMIPLASFDNALDGFMRDHFGIATGLLFSGTIGAVTFGYIVRFLALAFGTVEASLHKITLNLEGASRTLGRGPGATLKRIHLPMMRGSLLTAVLLVFVDGMKELPMTVALRPFNFETLATFVHQYASDELLAECSLAALTIVGAGIIPVILLSMTIARSRPGQSITAEDPLKPNLDGEFLAEKS